MATTTRLSDRIAQLALSHYSETLPTKGKAQAHEWTVFGALLASEEQLDKKDDKSEPSLWVVSSATGTKCTAQRRNGCVLHDCHAEVLVRRGLVRCLWSEILAKKNSTKHPLPPGYHPLLEDSDDSSTRFQLRSNIKLYLYISDSPCGDSSIYKIGDSLQFTGAKVIVSPETNVTVEACGGSHQIIDQDLSLAREDTQLLGKLRSKSGRSNLEVSRRSTSMSCSDKLVRWGILGMQGRSLSKLIPHPLTLAGVVISQDPRATKVHQEEALRRGLTSRIITVQQVMEESSIVWPKLLPPTTSICAVVFPNGKSAMENASNSANRKRKREDSDVSDSTKISPAGMSMNWQQCDPSLEIVVGARGIRHGKKPKLDKDFRDLKSRLSRSSMLKFLQGSNFIKDSKEHNSYQNWKQGFGSNEYDKARQFIFTNGPLAGWITSEESSDWKLGEKP